MASVRMVFAVPEVVMAPLVALSVPRGCETTSVPPAVRVIAPIVRAIA